MSNLYPTVDNHALLEAVRHEEQRQHQHIELIASENYASKAVMDMQGSQLTNKYAEGYPKRRYYGGCTYVDEVELIAIQAAKQLFNAEYVNVQPHSGSSANSAVFLALLSAGDTILGMDLSQGGHLTHGSHVNFSGKLYKPCFYGVNDNGEIDYDEVERIAVTEQPKLIIAGFSAYSGLLDYARFREIADKVGAYLLADMAHVAGLVATGLYPSPMNHAHVVTTTTHKTLRASRGGMILSNDVEIGKKLNSGVFPGSQGGPLMHAIAGKAQGFLEALDPSFTNYQQRVLDNAQTMAETLRARGVTLVSGGTQNHLMVISLIDKGITGKALDARLGEAFITVNKNTVPNDPQSPMVTSGIRIGTPAITTRGFGATECAQVANWIADVIADIDNDAVIAQTHEAVVALCDRFPIYT